jgi:hypothetical protein
VTQAFVFRDYIREKIMSKNQLLESSLHESIQIFKEGEKSDKKRSSTQIDKYQHIFDVDKDILSDSEEIKEVIYH